MSLFYEDLFIILLREFGYYILRLPLSTHWAPCILIHARYGINTEGRDRIAQNTELFFMNHVIVTFNEPLFIHPVGTSIGSDNCDLSKVPDPHSKQWRIVLIASF